MNKFAGTLCLLIALLASVEAYRTIEFVRAVPDWMIVRLAPIYAFDDEGSFVTFILSPLRDELKRRQMDNAIDSHIFHVYARRLLDGLASDEMLVYTRSEWPTNVQVRGGLVCPHYLDIVAPAVLRVHTSNGLTVYERQIHPSSDSAMMLGWKESTFVIPDSELNNGKVALTVSLSDVDHISSPIALETVELSVDRCRAFEEVLRPIEGNFQSLFDLHVVETIWRTGRVFVTIKRVGNLDPSVAIGLRFEVIEEGSLLAATEYWHPCCNKCIEDELISVMLDYELLDSDRAKTRQLRVMPDPCVALRDMNKSRFLQFDEFFVRIVGSDR